MSSMKDKQFFFDAPLLEKVTINFPEDTRFDDYPFSLPIVKNLTTINFPTQVTFFVGENGSGKSTIIETIASLAGFGPEGGSKHIQFKTSEEVTYTGVQKLADCLTLSWVNKPVKNGYFFRAESFFNVANYIDSVGVQQSYGGKSLHAQSHGESFMSFFTNRLWQGGFFIFDEPEAALSPQRQLTLLTIINDMCKKNPQTQFIIVTHSPILLAYPDATIYSCDGGTLKKIAYQETDHYQITKYFLNNHERYLHSLFNDEL